MSIGVCVCVVEMNKSFVIQWSLSESNIKLLLVEAESNSPSKIKLLVQRIHSVLYFKN